MASQTLSLGTLASNASWTGAILVDPGFVVGGVPAYLRVVNRVGSSIQVRLAANTTDEPNLTGPEFIPELETAVAAFTFSDDEGNSLVLKGPDNPDNAFVDPTEPYFWTPDNSAEMVAYWSGVRTNMELVLDDGVDPPATDHDVDAGAVAFAFTIPQPTVTTSAQRLVLSDSDDTGLDVDCKALLVASDAGTVGDNFFYVDADRGGIDEPLDGELGLGSDNTVISGFRRRTTTLLQLNDSNNPAALDIGAYFAAGGAGNDLTIYLQTLLDGEVSFPVAGNVPFVRADQVRFTLPDAAQTLLDNIAIGDRFIFKLARPSTVPVDHAVDAGDANFVFAIPQPTVTHTARVTTDHAVNAGAAAFSFTIPQPSVTHTPHVPTDHAVNSGDVAFAFALPEPTVTHTPRVTADHAVDAGAASFAFAVPQPSVTHTERVTTDHAVDAGDASWAFAIPQPTVTHTPPAQTLVLSDSDDTGLDVDCKALLVASDAGTVGNFIYEDADRGGTDTPLDGELGLGVDGTIISGIRRRTATLLQLNDNNSPAALDIGAYFSTGGAGVDLTVYLQTLSDGEVSFPATASFSRTDQVRFTLPSDGQTLLDNLANGERWIFKLARPATVPPLSITPVIVDGDLLGELVGALVLGEVSNQAPTANAGPGQLVYPAVPVTLDGTGSSDPEGAVTYSWDQQSGPTVVLSDPTSAQPTFTAPDQANFSSLVFELTVTDTGGLVDSAVVVIGVRGRDPIALVATIIDGGLSGNLVGSLGLGSSPAIEITPDPIDGGLSGELVGSLALPIQITPSPIEGGLSGELVGSVGLGISRIRTHVSTSFIRSAFRQETQEVWLILLTLSHPDLTDDIRVVHNPETISSRGQDFIGFAFDLTLPSDTEDQAPVAELRIDNVSREIAQAVRSISSAPTVTIEIIRAADPDVVEISLTGFTLRNARWDALAVSGSLALDDISIEPYPAGSFTPASFPGLF